ncbi:hypothetical protein J8281_01225 [Aquimarina sp. U1-2]|uniref:hypothetical protein n=1 Tax=Aquimarina sp. U1-2 TaxID=2823141 RepID=UPI001AECD06A|nr:hypothetical protein [Aquimarina sp. U1-2]MBP2830794.1 hypothetical protein [Aquimarina sp. U1-2]
MTLDAILFEPGSLDGIIYIILAILLGPPAFLSFIGFLLFYNRQRKAGKVFFILAGIYLVVGLGICGVMMSGF